MMADPLAPVDMEWLENGVLSILWSDRHRGVYPVRHLRQQCPCAGCVDEWSGERRITPESIPLLIRVEDVNSVGHYALRFSWSDGHDTGIYSYSLLRALCQCETCQPEQSGQSDAPRGKVLL